MGIIFSVNMNKDAYLFTFCDYTERVLCEFALPWGRILHPIDLINARPPTTVEKVTPQSMLMEFMISPHHQNNHPLMCLTENESCLLKKLTTKNNRHTLTFCATTTSPPFGSSLFVDCQNRIANQAHKGWLSCSRKPEQTAMLRPLQLGCNRTLKRQHHHHHLPLCPLMKLNCKRRSMTTRGSM